MPFVKEINIYYYYYYPRIAAQLTWGHPHIALLTRHGSLLHTVLLSNEDLLPGPEDLKTRSATTGT